ncbi:MAG TPA: hypothetical protein VJA21_23265 [Verrucomicrobiae bacterium]
MAGYLMNLDNLESLRLYMRAGVYGTVLSQPNRQWLKHHEATFADYVTMKAGDNIYFFIDRKIYGIGQLVNLGGDCKFLNFKDACTPQAFTYDAVKAELLWDEGILSANQRWICAFRPSPHFFRRGLDMDDMLASNPSAFRTLRAFWKVSFIKLDDNENQAFKDALLKLNQDALLAPDADHVFGTEWQSQHAALHARVQSSDYRLKVAPMLAACADGDRLRHEMAVEAGLLYQLAYSDPPTEGLFGSWGFLHHQVVASPFKPIDYMDRMDLFGYAFIPAFEPTKSRFLVGEIKKDAGTTADLEQLLKYVDWVKDEYAFGDYGMIKAYLIAHDFEGSVIEGRKEIATRRYIVGRRPAKSCEWSDLSLVKYAYDPEQQRLAFTIAE